ncbi:hypothetical protein [Bosea sp. Root483D1]|nr:hypothetical protein [Bosea sp. Root483D1]
MIKQIVLAAALAAIPVMAVAQNPQALRAGPPVAWLQEPSEAPS